MIELHEIGKALGATESQMFGKPCLKVDGKAFACWFEDCLVLKLPQPEHGDAMAWDGSKLFDPSGKGRAMKEWVQIERDHRTDWERLARVSMEYVRP